MAMIHGYISLIILDQKPLNFEKTALFLINRLESIVNDFGDEVPLLTKETMQDFLQVDEEIGDLQLRIDTLRKGWQDASASVLSSLDLLESEFTAGEPREFVAEALLLYLEKQFVDDEWKLEVGNLEKAITRFFRLRKNR
jgi:hypothetical protein